MNKIYAPQDIEQACYHRWESNHYFEPKGEGQPYCIMLPPPNVTGSLHMGHGFQQTLMDALTRYHRMQGYKTLWQPGTDHAGISTQLVVERQLEAEGISPKGLSREDFLKRVWEWKAIHGDQITNQMRKLGASVDWSRECFTMDEELSEAVKKVFIQLYEEGLIYRGERLVNWDPKLQTAISDLEVVSQEESGSLWYIRYPLVQPTDTLDALIIATTRPETLLADAALAVNPEDERYQDLIGKEVILPLCNRTIPIIADHYADKTFGTGCVKITPAHDFNDYEVGRRHNLPIINILNKDGTLNLNAPEPYQGLDRFEARECLIKALDDSGFLVKVEPHKLKVPRNEKSGAIIEPFATEQWYLQVESLAKPAIDAVKKGSIKFTPENWTKIYFQWMENIEDWCISRQLLWGHRIPAWYDEAGQIYVGYSEQDVRFKYKLPTSMSLKQDEDVLDTWFSSALWPFTTLGWPEKTQTLETFYPTSVLVTGFDIIFFWVARMIMMGLKFTGKVPFKQVLITGLILDSEGQKMSKTKGNVLDPIDLVNGCDLESLIKKRTQHLIHASKRDKIAKMTKKEFPQGIPAYGTDALRFAFCFLSSTGRTIRFDITRIEACRNFCNKLWNASRFVLLNTEEEYADLGDGPFQYSTADEWILSRLQNTISQAHHYFSIYRFDLLANTLYDFVWHEYCDWYLELSKAVLYHEQALSAMKRGTRRTLIHVLDHILKLLHPLIPFITEEIWGRTGKLSSQPNDSLMLSTYPQVDSALINLDIENEISWLQHVIQNIRTIRSEMKISPVQFIPLYLKHASEKDKSCLAKYESIVLSLCKLSGIHYLNPSESTPIAASSVIGELELLIPIAGLIDAEAELGRLSKELQKLEEEITFTQRKLNNPSFGQKAPAEVIKKEQEKLSQASLAKEKLLTHKHLIEQL